MSLSAQKYLIVIAGPTAVGKSDIAFRLAQHFHTDILSADSRQCFREMNIGTAKPTEDELALVRHYFINTHSVREEISAGQYEIYALKALDRIFAHNPVAIVCGGTGLYLSALLRGMDDIPPVSKHTEETVISSYNLYGYEWLKNEIEKNDPLYAATENMVNPARMMRALVFKLSVGRSILSYRSKKHRQRPFRVIGIGLELPRTELYERINHRVDRMVEEGLVEEAKALFPFRHHKNLRTVGYQEFYSDPDSFPADEQAIAQAVTRIKQHTRNYAKRQLTWFRNKENLQWFSPYDFSKITTYCEAMISSGNGGNSIA